MYDLVNFKISWSARNLKTSLRENMIIKKCWMNATMMKITIRGIIIKAQGSTQNLIFQNFKEECMLMTSWIGLIRLKASLSIVKITPPPPEHIKVNLVAKMSKNASFWWENIKRHGKKKI